MAMQMANSENFNFKLPLSCTILKASFEKLISFSLVFSLVFS